MANCKRHPVVETNLYCGKCGDPICPKCMVQTPVGARCPTCAKVSRIPTYRVTGIYYLRAIGAGMGLSIVLGLIWGFIRTFPFVGFFNFLIGAAVGYGIGEGISYSVNRKRGVGLAVIGGLAMVVSYLISAFLIWGLHFSLFDIIAVVLGIFASVSLLR
jgi:hypothetical protein